MAYKVNVNAPLVPKGGGVVDSILRNDKRECLGASVRGIKHIENPLFLEAMAFEEGIKLTLSRRINKVIIEDVQNHCESHEQ